MVVSPAVLPRLISVPVVVAGSDGSEVPPIYIDTVGIKAGIEDTYSRNSKGSLNLVAQQVHTCRRRPPQCVKASAGQMC